MAVKRDALGGRLLRESLRGVLALAFAAAVGYASYVLLTTLVEHI